MSSQLTIHPAERAARAAMTAVTEGDRAAWLAAYARYAVLHDPVGGSPLDPDGAGLSGRAALEQFWDLTIAPNDVRFAISAVHPAGQEAAVVASRPEGWTAEIANPTSFGAIVRSQNCSSAARPRSPSASGSSGEPPTGSRRTALSEYAASQAARSPLVTAVIAARAARSAGCV